MWERINSTAGIEIISPRPLQKSSKALSILIAFVGIMFTGILVSITLETSAIAFRQHVDVAALVGG